MISIQAQLFPELLATMFEVKVEKEKELVLVCGPMVEPEYPGKYELRIWSKARLLKFLNLIGKGEEKRKGSGKRKR